MKCYSKKTCVLFCKHLLAVLGGQSSSLPESELEEDDEASDELPE